MGAASKSLGVGRDSHFIHAVTTVGPLSRFLLLTKHTSSFLINQETKPISPEDTTRICQDDLLRKGKRGLRLRYGCPAVVIPELGRASRLTANASLHDSRASAMLVRQAAGPCLRLRQCDDGELQVGRPVLMRYERNQGIRFVQRCPNLLTRDNRYHSGARPAGSCTCNNSSTENSKSSGGSTSYEYETDFTNKK